MHDQDNDSCITGNMCSWSNYTYLLCYTRTNFCNDRETLHLQIKQEDLIGGTIVSGTTIQIWYCKHATQSPDRPIR